MQVPPAVIFRGAVFADNARFDRCLQLWMHAMRLKLDTNTCVVKDLLRFAQVTSPSSPIFFSVYIIALIMNIFNTSIIIDANVRNISRVKACLLHVYITHLCSLDRCSLRWFMWEWNSTSILCSTCWRQQCWSCSATITRLRTPAPRMMLRQSRLQFIYSFDLSLYFVFILQIIFKFNLNNILVR